jgi:nicotinate-nucleotide adenylyltransferase
MKNQSILVFGGSFDPPHKYHKEILKYSIKKIKPSKTIIFTTYHSPLKEGHLSPYTHRKKMFKILIKKEKINCIFDDFEFKRGKKTYTYQIGRYLKKKYPKSTLYFLMGSDSFENIEKWKRYKEVLKTFKIILAKRKGYPINLTKIKKYKPIILEKEFINVSSTEIREKIMTLNFSLIDKDIKNYILKNKLYFTGIILSIKKILSPKRFKHTLSVIKTSLELAKHYGADLKKTFLAALLHDCAKEIPIKKQIELIKKEKIKIKKFDEVIKNAPQILHQWASFIYAKKKFKINDKDVLLAISRHTTAHKNMKLLDKIIYVADFISDDREFYEAKVVRKLVFRDIELAFQKTKEFKTKYIKEKGEYLYE